MVATRPVFVLGFVFVCFVGCCCCCCCCCSVGFLGVLFAFFGGVGGVGLGVSAHISMEFVLVKTFKCQAIVCILKYMNRTNGIVYRPD